MPLRRARPSPISYTSLLALCTSPIPFRCHTLIDQKSSAGVPRLLELLLYPQVLEIQHILFIIPKIQWYNGICSDNQHQNECCHMHITEKHLKKGCVASIVTVFSYTYNYIHYRSLPGKDCSLRYKNNKNRGCMSFGTI